MAFASATHDIAADGFYLLALPAGDQAAFVGVRSTAYRLAMIAGQGGLVYLAGTLTDLTGQPTRAWAVVFWILAGLFMLFAAYHAWALPRPAADRPAPRGRASGLGREALAVFAAFFRKPGIGTILAFLLLYRFGEAQLLKLAAPFLLDGREAGGLGLTTQQVGLYYGTVGVVALTLGGLAGGWAVSRLGLKRLLWPMIVAMHAPNLVYVALAATRPGEPWIAGAAVAFEQLGYGFGFTAYLLYLMLVSEGEHRTAHYAIGTGFMALGMMLPGMGAGWLQERLGYPLFFAWACLATLPSVAVAARLRIPEAFGRK
jgi:PAT family beta-lactamase induction signal transducer AmpG